MLVFLWDMMSFFILIFILVGFHEFGHFYTARKLGIKVLKFSIGFGKPIYTHTAKDGCEYILGAIPLGGFVMMLDEREGHVSEEQKHLAFNTQPIWKRFLVVLAGPLANGLLAFVLLFGLYLYGVPAYKAEIGTPMPNTPFAQAQLQKGDTVLQVDGKNISSFQQLTMTLIDKLGDGQATLQIKRNNTLLDKVVTLDGAIQLDGTTDLVSLLGLSENLPDLKTIIQEPTPNMPASLAGLEAGDEILKMNGEPITNIRMVNRILQTASPNISLSSSSERSIANTINFEIRRDDQILHFDVLPTKNDDNKFVIGVMLTQQLNNKAEFDAALANMLITQRYSFFDSMQRAYQETLDNGVLVFKFIARMIKGDVKISAMGGPLTIGDIAGNALKSGLVSFISLVALLSINIGAMNLIPIPVLDGGRLVGYMFEAIANLFKFKISARLGLFTLQIGGIIMIAFMGMVVFYDVVKYVIK